MTGAATTFLVFWLLTTAALAAHVVYMRRETAGRHSGEASNSNGGAAYQDAAPTAAPRAAPRRPVGGPHHYDSSL